MKKIVMLIISMFIEINIALIAMGLGGFYWFGLCSLMNWTFIPCGVGFCIATFGGMILGWKIAPKVHNFFEKY